MKKLLLLLLLVGSVAFAQLSGTYSIGSTSIGGEAGHYTSLKLACDALNTNSGTNITGDCTFYIMNSLTEAVNVGMGANTNGHTITFKPYTGITATITFTKTADNAGASGGFVIGVKDLTISSATNYGLTVNDSTERIVIDGSNTIGGTSRDLTFSTGAGVAAATNPIRIFGNTNFVTVKNVIVSAATPTYTILISPRLDASSNNYIPDDITIENCSITNTQSAAQGVAISVSGAPTKYTQRVVIKNNIITAKSRGIFLNGAGSTDIEGNTISLTQTAGFLLSGIMGNLVGPGSTINIFKNKFTTLSSGSLITGEGLQAIYAASNTGGTYNIYNNIIYGFASTGVTATTSPNFYGIYATCSGTSNVYHNSLYLADLSITGGTVLYQGIKIGATAGTYNVKNNIVSLNEDGFKAYGIYSGITSGVTSNNNDIYRSGTTNAKFGFWSATDQADRSAWNTASSQDANSIETNPQFTSSSNLALLNTSPCRDAGANVGITTDFDGNLRTLPYDIGAYEYQTTTISSNSSISGSYGDLTIDADVTMSGDVTASLITINAGKNLTVGGYTFTTSNPISGTGTFIAGSTSSMVFAGTASGIIIPMNINDLNNLTIANSSGVTMNNLMSVWGKLTLTSGTLTTNDNLIMSDGATISRSAGLLSAAPAYSGTINLEYTGTTVAAGIEYSGISGTTAGTTLNNLTINLSSGTFTTAFSRRINGKLYLTSGIHGSGAEIYLAPGATISRSGGSISSTIADQSSPDYNTLINLEYTGSSAITTGNEFHSAVGINNLTNTSSGVLTIGTSDSISGNLTHSNGTLAVGANLLGIGGNFSVNSGVISAASSSGRFICTGAGKTFTLASAAVARITANITQTPAATNAFDYQVNGFTTYNLATSSYISFRNPAATQAYTLNIGGLADGSSYGNMEFLSNGMGAFVLSFDFVSNVNIAGFLAFPAITTASPTYTVNFNSHTIKIGGAITLNGVNTNTQAPTRVYNSGTSTIELNGSSAQAGIGGANLPATFNNVTINNSTGVTLSGATTVNGTLSFAAGKLTTGANTLTLGASGSVSGEATGKYVVGNLVTTQAVGTSASTLGGIGVSLDAGGADDLGSVSVTRVSGLGGAITANGSTGIYRNWTISSTNPPTNGRTLTLSWVSDDDNGKDLINSKVFKSIDAGATWNSVGVTQDALLSRSVAVSVTDFSKWTVSDASTSLPVELTSLKVSKYGYGAKVEWKTATELNNFGFEIERRSVVSNTEQTNEVSTGQMTASKNEAWTKTGFVEGAGNSNAPKEYSFVDKNMVGGTYQYRLKMTDRDGSFRFSSSIELKVEGMPLIFTLSQNYPNPFNPTTTVEFSVAKQEMTSIKMYDIVGREVQTLFNEVAQPGQMYTLHVNGTMLASGTYFYVMQSQNFRSVKKMSLLK